MAAGIGNPVGYVPVADGGNPGIISGRARAALSGGTFAFASGAADVVSSGLNSFDPTTDLLFANGASGNQWTGIVTQSAASGASVSLATKGKILVLAENTVTAGQSVSTGGANGVLNGATAGQAIGRVLTSATSGGFTIIDLF